MDFEAGKVLIVEDDDAIRVLLRAVLAERGYEVLECVDGSTAFEQARDERPDVVLLDLGLPAVDGLTVLDLLKQDARTRDVPVLVVTAWDSGELVARALGAGAVDYVRKPFHVAELSARVESVVRTRARHAELEMLASIDALTGVMNRRGIDAELERRTAANQRTDSALSVLMVDIDRFKAINDNFGHVMGDEVLRAVAVRLRRQLRGGDVVARWGGEEFAVVASIADPGHAEQLGERLRAVVAAAPIGDIDVTVSVGVAVWDTREDAARVVERADGALYRAKADGRDQVRVAPPERHLRRVA